MEKDSLVLVVTENGYGKLTDLEEYRLTHRGSKGVKGLNITDKNGTIIALKCLSNSLKQNYDLILMTDSGMIIKLPLDQVSILKRATQGVRLINLKENQLVSTVTLVEKDEAFELYRLLNLLTISLVISICAT